MREMCDEINLENAILYADSSRGVYIPQWFAESIKRDCARNVSNEEFAILESGPDHEFYWDVWSIVEQNAIVTNPVSGIAYYLYQDGDLWLVPVDE